MQSFLKSKDAKLLSVENKKLCDSKNKKNDTCIAIRNCNIAFIMNSNYYVFDSKNFTLQMVTTKV